MNNELTLFDRFPNVFPTKFERDIPSSLFDVFNNFFNTSELKKMTVYPTDIYEVLENGKPVKTVIEIATAGITKDKCKVKVEGNKLFVDIGAASVPIQESEKAKVKTEPKEEKEGSKEPEITRRYKQKEIAQRSAYMSWTLSDNINKKKIDVKYVNGVLTITIPYNTKSKESDIIDIEIQD